MAVTLDEYIKVDTELLPGAIRLGNFDTTTFVTKEQGNLDPGGPNSVRSYQSYAAVAADGFSPTGEVLAAARAYFSQPNVRAFRVGFWHTGSPASTTLYGGTPATPGNIGIVSPQTIYYGAEGQAVVGLDASSTTTQVANAVQTALRSLLGNSAIVVLYDSTNVRYLIDMQGTNAFDNKFTGAFAAAIGWTTGARVSQGAITETLTQALDKVDRYLPSYYMTGETSIMDTADAELMAAWAQANKRRTFIESAIPLDSLTGSQFKTIMDKRRRRVAGIWSANRDYKSVSAAGFGAGKDLDLASSAYTYFFKGLPGTLADDLSNQQAQALDDINANAYTRIAEGKFDGFVKGKTSEVGVWLDQVHSLDWFELRVQEAVANFIRGADSVPFTANGIKSLQSVVEGVCDTAYDSGIIATGVAPQAMALEIRQVTDNPGFDGTMPLGYLVHIADPSTVNRSLRKAPPVTVWLLGSGSVQEFAARVVFGE